jgi:hypothetical protein
MEKTVGASVGVGLAEAHLPGEQAVVLWPKGRMRFEETAACCQDHARLAAIAVPAPVLDVML